MFFGSIFFGEDKTERHQRSELDVFPKPTYNWKVELFFWEKLRKPAGLFKPFNMDLNLLFYIPLWTFYRKEVLLYSGR